MKELLEYSKTTLAFSELEETVLDLEQTLNNGKITYKKDEMGFLTLTPKSLIFGVQNHISTIENKHGIRGKDLKEWIIFKPGQGSLANL